MTHADPFARMALLFGPEAMERLSCSTVAVIGIGGVGGHCVEALARCGIGRFLLMDGDSVSITNINRQTIAFHSTIGRHKVDVMRQRILDIHPQAEVSIIPQYYTPGDDRELWSFAPDIIVDAIDMVTAKVDIALQAQYRGIPCISCMGAGNKLDPTRFVAADLYETSVCPLCRATRKLARQKGITSLRVVYSTELPSKPKNSVGEGERPVPGSVVYVTATAGLLAAHEAIRLLLAPPEDCRAESSLP